MNELDDLVATLERHRQRATYKAVADFLYMSPQSLMNALSPSRKASFVVLERTGLPSGYSAVQMHEDLEKNRDVIGDYKSLAGWLRTHY